MQAIKQKSNVLAPLSFHSPRRNLMPVICFKTIILHFLFALSKADIRGRLLISSFKRSINSWQAVFLPVETTHICSLSSSNFQKKYVKLQKP